MKIGVGDKSWKKFHKKNFRFSIYFKRTFKILRASFSEAPKREACYWREWVLLYSISGMCWKLSNFGFTLQSFSIYGIWKELSRNETNENVLPHSKMAWHVVNIVICKQYFFRIKYLTQTTGGNNLFWGKERYLIKIFFFSYNSL